MISNVSNQSIQNEKIIQERNGINLEKNLQEKHEKIPFELSIPSIKKCENIEKKFTPSFKFNFNFEKKSKKFSQLSSISQKFTNPISTNLSKKSFNSKLFQFSNIFDSNKIDKKEVFNIKSEPILFPKKVIISTPISKKKTKLSFASTLFKTPNVFKSP